MEFQHGPFTFTAAERLALAGEPSQRWRYSYGQTTLAEKILPAGAGLAALVDAFDDERADFERTAADEHGPEMLDLVDQQTGDAVAYLPVAESVGLTPGLIDDRSRYWLRSRDDRRSRDVTLTEFAAVAARHTAPKRHWISGLLPDHVLSDDPELWRAPSNFELRHIIGAGSFTGISGAAAAELVGVTPQNFRKYTAPEGSSGRQKISFAMWHLLLHKLGVKRLGVA